jgi:hypothetical protein
MKKYLVFYLLGWGAATLTAWVGDFGWTIVIGIVTGVLLGVTAYIQDTRAE